MGIVETGVEVAKALVPPRTNDLDAQQRWRWIVFGVLITLSVGFCTHIALECGYIPAIYPGFSSVHDVEQIQKRVDVIAILSLEHEMRTKAAELCKATDPQIRSDLNDDISKLQKEYYEVAKQYYQIPRCSQL